MKEQIDFMGCIVFIRVHEAIPIIVAFLCLYFCVSCSCKYAVCLTQKQLVKFELLKKKRRIKKAVFSLCVSTDS